MVKTSNVNIITHKRFTFSPGDSLEVTEGGSSITAERENMIFKKDKYEISRYSEMTKTFILFSRTNAHTQINIHTYEYIYIYIHLCLHICG